MHQLDYRFTFILKIKIHIYIKISFKMIRCLLYLIKSHNQLK